MLAKGSIMKVNYLDLLAATGTCIKLIGRYIICQLLEDHYHLPAKL
jgi:hypothetical protein